MKKIFTALLLLIFSGPLISAQPTQAEMDKMIKNAKEEIEKMRKDPKNKDLMNTMPDMDSIMKKMGTVPGAAKNKKPDSTASTNFSLPSRNEKYLGCLPIRTFTKAELVSYLHNLNATLTELLRNSYGTDIKDISIDNSVKTGTSIAFWISGQPYKSVLIALKGAEINPDNTTLLNNIGGILTSSGLAVNAIPVLQYANEHQPENNVILNNLGQAYFKLGDLKKAEQYLMQSIGTAKYFPDANLTLAYIYNGKGDKASAIKFAENSLTGAYSADAWSLLTDLKPRAKLMDYVRKRYKQPEFFNYHKYPLLPQCEKVDDAPVLKPQYGAYQQVLWDLGTKYDQLSRQENELAKKTEPDIMTKAIKDHRSPYRPFGFFAMAVLADLNKENTDQFLRYDKYKKDYDNEKKTLDAKYESEIKAINDHWDPILDDLETGSPADEEASRTICKQKNDVGNTYLPQYAILTQSFQMETIKLYRNYLNDWSYWSYIASVDDHGYKAVFYSLASTMISTLRDINQTKFILPCTTPERPLKSKANAAEIEDPNCFFTPKIVLPLGGVNLEINCEGYKLEAGEGLIGKIEYSSQSGDITVAFGVGGKAPKLFFEEGGVEAGVEGEVKSQFFITFNKGTAIDCGVLWEAEIKAKFGLGAATRGADAVETSIGVEEGLTAGFGSGVNMKEGGPLKSLIDKMYPVQPDDKQINKNVPLYKK